MIGKCRVGASKHIFIFWSFFFRRGQVLFAKEKRRVRAQKNASKIESRPISHKRQTTCPQPTVSNGAKPSNKGQTKGKKEKNAGFVRVEQA
jgi:hypothetical protein